MSAFSRLYQRRVFPWLNDLVCSEPAIAQLRAETLATSTGRVIEIVFGTGLDLPHYPAGVSELVAVEPNAGMVDRSGTRLRAAAFPMRIVNGDDLSAWRNPDKLNESSRNRCCGGCHDSSRIHTGSLGGEHDCYSA